MLHLQLSVSDLSGGSGTVPLRLASVCSAANPLTYQFSVRYNLTHAVVTINGGTPEFAVLSFTAGRNRLFLSIGNTPGCCCIKFFHVMY